MFSFIDYEFQIGDELDFSNAKRLNNDVLQPPFESTGSNSSTIGPNNDSLIFSGDNLQQFDPYFGANSSFPEGFTPGMIRNMDSEILPMPVLDDKDKIYDPEVTNNSINISQHEEYVSDFFTGKFSLESKEGSSEHKLQVHEDIVCQEKIRKKIVKRIKPDKRKASKKESGLYESKNIVKNYGKAMATFSISELATPYYKQILTRYEGVTLDDVREYMINKKEIIDSIGSLRSLLYADPANDSPQEFNLKSIFRDISEVFLRYFSVNWICSSKCIYKSALLDYRFNMLRRVMNPTGFTYLKSQ